MSTPYTRVYSINEYFLNIFITTGLASSHWALTATDEYGTVGFAGLWEKCANLNIGAIEPEFECRGFVWEDVQVSRKS